jgi:hypothetical protein
MLFATLLASLTLMFLYSYKANRAIQTQYIQKLCSMHVALSKTNHSEKRLTLKLKNFMRPGIHLISCPIILKDETMSRTLKKLVSEFT